MSEGLRVDQLSHIITYQSIQSQIGPPTHQPRCKTPNPTGDAAGTGAGSGAAWAPTDEDGEGGAEGGGEGEGGGMEVEEEELAWEERGAEFHPAVAGYKERFKVRSFVVMVFVDGVRPGVNQTSRAPSSAHMYIYVSMYGPPHPKKNKK